MGKWTDNLADRWMDFQMLMKMVILLYLPPNEIFIIRIFQGILKISYNTEVKIIIAQHMETEK